MIKIKKNYSTPKDQELEELYEQLENNALHLETMQIAGLFKVLRDKKEEEGNLTVSKIAQWEITFFFYDSCPIGNLEYKEKIPWDRYEEKQFTYLMERQKTVKNKMLKAHYSHILWLSPKKEIEFARDAVDSYLWLSEYYSNNQETGLKFITLTILNVIINAYRISFQIKYKTEEAKCVLISLVKDYKQNDESVAVIKLKLIELMIQDRKNFTNTDLDGVDQFCESYSVVLSKKAKFILAIDILEIGKKVSSILKRCSINWVGMIATCYENLMQNHKKKNTNLALDFCESAIRNYRDAGDEEKVKELEKQFTQLKKQQKFMEIAPPFSKKTKQDYLDGIEMYEKDCRTVAERLVKEKSSEEIINILIYDKSFVPKLDEVEHITVQDMKKRIFSQLLPVHLIDRQGHKAEIFHTKEEKKKFELLRNYRVELKMRYVFLNEVIIAALKNEKLNFTVLEKYLKNYSWLGKSLPRTYANDHIIEFNWLSLLTPSLKSYFEHTTKCLEDNSFNPNYVLCIDSLILKIEGIIRDLCKFSNISTTYIPRNRDVVMEKDIHHLFREEELKGIINADDLFFFKFVLIEKGGYNLRHNVAHSLLLPNDYSLYFMNLLFLILLKLA